MKYKLINPINTKYTTTEQILINRGIAYENIKHYINTTDEDINPPEKLGKPILAAAALSLGRIIKENKKAIIVIDCDCDGYTSAALLINYLYDLFPTWVKNNLSWIIHNGKQHGLADCIDKLLILNPALVLVPDAGTNDINECKKLANKNIKVIILDHHDKEIDNPYAIIINNQLCNYPNKELSGVGVTWQFCRYLDNMMEVNHANKYIDLVAVGLIADMVSLRSFETKHLIHKGLQEVHNPFIMYLAEKNAFSLKDKLTPIGVAFYIAPFINAIVRSGKQNEKETVFKSMLSFEAFKIVPSTKKGHRDSDTEKIVEQAVRIATNVKARQTKLQNEGMELLENILTTKNLFNHRVLLFLLEPGQIDANIVGLCANKIMAKYQRPVCVLTKHTDVSNHLFTYDGSARGCDKIDIKDFKKICNDTGVTEYTIGHPGAFGLSLKKENINTFLNKTDEILKNIPNEVIYYVDYIETVNSLNAQRILDIASMEYYWGKDVSEPLIALLNVQITPDMVTIYDKKTITIKITLINGINLMLFNATDNDCKILQENNTGNIIINIIGTCQQNEWLGNISPQIFIEEYQVIDSKKFIF